MELALVTDLAEVKKMNGTNKLSFILAILMFWGAQPVHPQELEDSFYGEAVEYRDGEISVAFSQTPVVLALTVIEARTGLQIIVPAAVENKLVNLRLDRQALEPAFRAVVLGAQPRALASAEAQSEDAVAANQPLATGEREKLQSELERWSDLKQEERGRIEDRLKSLPPSDEREQLLQEYGRQALGVKK